MVAGHELPGGHGDERLLNECASAIRAGPSPGPRRACRRRLQRASACQGFRTTARFPNTLPTFTLAVSTGSSALRPTPPSDFGTSVTQVADTFSWQRGRHVFKLGADLRWERLNVIQPPSPTGSSRSATCSPISRACRTPECSWPASCSGRSRPFDRPAAGSDPEPGALPGVLRPGRLAHQGSPHGQCRRALHAEFSLNRREQPGRGAQPGDRGNSNISAATATTSRPRAAQGQLRASAAERSAASPTRPLRELAMADLDRAGRDHDAVHDAGLPLPADRLAAHAGQHRAGVHFANGPRRADRR